MLHVYFCTFLVAPQCVGRWRGRSSILGAVGPKQLGRPHHRGVAELSCEQPRAYNIVQEAFQPIVLFVGGVFVVSHQSIAVLGWHFTPGTAAVYLGAGKGQYQPFCQ